MNRLVAGTDLEREQRAAWVAKAAERRNDAIRAQGIEHAQLLGWGQAGTIKAKRTAARRGFMWSAAFALAVVLGYAVGMLILSALIGGGS